jgi:adenine-specific DNA-methyltransferase
VRENGDTITHVEEQGWDMSEFPVYRAAPPIEPQFRPEAEIVVFAGDVTDFLTHLPDNSVALIVTSPPYNVGKAYEHRVSLEQSLRSQAKVIAHLYRVLRNDGSMCWQVGNFVENGEVYPLDILYYPIFKELGMTLRNRIVWTFGHG